MKKIGIVGVMAWLSTVDYYSQLCRLAVAYDGSASETPEFMDCWRASRTDQGCAFTPDSPMLGYKFESLGISSSYPWSIFNEQNQGARSTPPS